MSIQAHKLIIFGFKFLKNIFLKPCLPGDFFERLNLKIEEAALGNK